MIKIEIMDSPSDFVETTLHFKVNHKLTGATASTHVIPLNTFPAPFAGICKIYLRSLVLVGNTITRPLCQVNLGISQPYSQSTMINAVPTPNQTIANLYFINDTNGDYGWDNLIDQYIIAPIYPNQTINITFMDNAGNNDTANVTTAFMVLDIVPLRRRENRGDAMMNLLKSQ